MERKTTGPGYATVAPMDEDGARQTSTKMSGRSKDILLAFAVMTIPMLCFSALLLGLVYHFRVTHSDSVSGNSDFNTTTPDPSAIYVRLSATTLTTVASWSSTAAPILIGFAVALVSYPVAQGILRAGRENQPKNLPTPYQLSLMLRMLSNGSPASLWHWMMYSFGWKGQRESQGKPIKTMTWTLFLGVILSLSVLITDTWLHFTTKSVNFTQISPNTIPSNHSFGLLPECMNVATTFSGGCTLNPAAANTFLMDGRTTLAVLGNISETTSVKTYASGNDQFAYLGNTPQTQLAAIDYTAHSWSVQSHCKPVSSECIDPDRVSGPSAPFNCPFAFQGRISTTYENALLMTYFTDSTGFNNGTTSTSLENPYYFAAVASVNQNLGRFPPLQNDTEVIYGLHGASIFVLFCNATVYDLEYSSVNGTITRFVTTPSNSSTVNIIQGSQQYTYVGDSNLLQASSIAGFSNSSQEIADRFAIAYSWTALAAASGAFTPQPAIESQVRTSMIVARVPKAPLACLLLSNLLLMVLGIALTVVAFATSGGDTREVQARLSIPALVAAQFEENRARKAVESVEYLFEERSGVRGPRVGLVQTAQNGWTFASWRPA